MAHSEDWFVDDVTQHDEEWYDDRYDHKYLGHKGLRELIRIIKLHIRELEGVLQEQLDNHEERLSVVENRLDDVTGASEGLTLEDFVNQTLERLQEVEDRLDGIDDRFDNFAATSESSESLTIEEVIQNIIDSIVDIESRISNIEVGSSSMTLQEFAEYVLQEFGEIGLELDELFGRVEALEETAVQGVEYNGVVYTPSHTSEGNIVDLNVIRQDLDDAVEALEEAIGRVIQISYQVVDELPAVGEPGVIYLVKIESSESSEGDNIYEEYIFIGDSSEGHFELIGTTEVDLSGVFEELDDLKDRLDHFIYGGEYDNDTVEIVVKSIEDKVLETIERLNDFDSSGESLEEAIEELVRQLNEYIPNILERLATLEALVTDGLISGVNVNNTPLDKDSSGEVNIPLVSQVYDGVVPKYSGTPSGYLQDGDIILVMRNSAPVWTEVDIYSLNPEPQPLPDLDIDSIDGAIIEVIPGSRYEAVPGNSFGITFNRECDGTIGITDEYGDPFPDISTVFRVPPVFVDSEHKTITAQLESTSEVILLTVVSADGTSTKTFELVSNI